MNSGWNRWVVAATAMICAVVMWGCKWKTDMESIRKEEFAEYMRVGVRDPSRMQIEWRYSTLRADGKTLVGVVIFRSVNGYGGYDFPSYYHVMIKEKGRVYFRETQERQDVLMVRKGEAEYLEEEGHALKEKLDGFLSAAEAKFEKMPKVCPLKLPKDLEEGDWTNHEAKRQILEMWKERFEIASDLEKESAEEVACAIQMAQEAHAEWQGEREGVYFEKGWRFEVSLDDRVKEMEARCAARRTAYAEDWKAGMARLNRLEARIEAAEKAEESTRQRAQAARERAQYEALKEARAREVAAAQEVAATEEEAQRWRAAAGEKMDSFMEEAVRFYAENHPSEASKYEIEDYRKFAAQLLLGIHRAMVAMKGKQEILAGGADAGQRDELERGITVAEGRIGELWQTLLVGIGVKKYTLQLERQGGHTLPRMKKSVVPFTPGSPTFSRYEPYLRELAGEAR